MLDALRMFHSLGASDGEIFHASETSVVYEYAAGALKVKSRGTDEGFGLRVLSGRKLGFSYANSKSKLESAVKSALAFSKFSQKSGFSFALKQAYPKTDSYDPKVAGLDEAALKEMVLELVAGVEEHSEVMRAILVCGTGKSAIANTSLLFAERASTSFMAYVEAKNKDGFGFADYSHYRIAGDLRALGRKAGLMAKEMKSPKKLQAGKYTVVFSQETLASLFGLLAASFSGDLKRRKISKLWDAEGKKMFDEKLTVLDDPFADAEARCAFDGEGVASKKRPLIEKGVVKDFYYSREIAALECVEKEGSCSRTDYKTIPGIGPSNTVIGTGDADLGTESSAESELGKYLYIESMHGLHTANTTTGDFGCEASIAFLHENGKKVPVRGFMVSENIFNLFNKIEAVGKRQMQAGDFVSPALAFRDVSIVS